VLEFTEDMTSPGHALSRRARKAHEGHEEKEAVEIAEKDDDLKQRVDLDHRKN
jgi:hypothetical protein